MDVTKTAEAVARASYGKLVAFLAARTRDVAGAEDALSEAFAAALVDWPQSGIPRAPETWLLTVARRTAQQCCPASAPGGGSQADARCSRTNSTTQAVKLGFPTSA